jgi:hypothetical protein
MTASGSGTGSFTGMTSSTGCAIFGGLTPGDYNVAVSQSGYVDKDGNSSPPANQQLTTVIAQSSTNKAFQYDQAASISANFTTTINGVSQPWDGDNFSVVNKQMTLPSIRTFGASGTYASSVTANNLFPFTNGYTAYAGACTADDPNAVNGSVTDQTATPPPGGPATPNPVLAMPAINVEVFGGTSSSPGPTLSPGSVHLIVTDTGCTPNVKHPTPPTGTWLSASNTVIAIPQPYGTFTVCADNGGGSNGYMNTYTAITNSNPAGNSVPYPIYLKSGTKGTVCT